MLQPPMEFCVDCFVLLEDSQTSWHLHIYSEIQIVLPTHLSPHRQAMPAAYLSN